MDNQSDTPQVVSQFGTVAFWVGVALVLGAWKFALEGLLE